MESIQTDDGRMHSSKMTKAKKRVEFNRIAWNGICKCQLSATCVCVCEQLLFVHKYIYFSPITATRMRMTSKNRTLLK